MEIFKDSFKGHQDIRDKWMDYCEEHKKKTSQPSKIDAHHQFVMRGSSKLEYDVDDTDDNMEPAVKLSTLEGQSVTSLMCFHSRFDVDKLPPFYESHMQLFRLFAG